MHRSYQINQDIRKGLKMKIIPYICLRSRIHEHYLSENAIHLTRVSLYFIGALHNCSTVVQSPFLLCYAKERM